MRTPGIVERTDETRCFAINRPLLTFRLLAQTRRDYHGNALRIPEIDGRSTKIASPTSATVRAKRSSSISTARLFASVINPLRLALASVSRPVH